MDHMQPDQAHAMYVTRSASGEFQVFAKCPDQPTVWDITEELRDQFLRPILDPTRA